MNWPAPTETAPTTDTPLVAFVRRWWWIPVTLAVLVVGAVITNADPADDVHPAVVDMVDTLEAQGDCESLQAAFDRYDDADTLTYIDDALRDAGCY